MAKHYVMDTQYQSAAVPQDQKTQAILAHILTIVAWIIAPLIIYLINKDTSNNFATEHAKESLNFQLSFTLYYIIGFILMLLIVGIFIVAALGILQLVFVIIATVKAANGEPFRYPMTIRFIS